MNPNYHSESLNMTMDRSHAAQMYGQDFSKVPVEWQQYMQSQMMGAHNPAASYFNDSMYASGGPLHQMTQAAQQQAEYEQMSLESRKLEQERMGSLTPQGTTNTPIPPSQHYDMKQEAPLNQLNQYTENMMSYPGGKVGSYSHPSPRNDRGLSDSPEKRNSPSVSMAYSRTPEMPGSHYSNEVNRYAPIPPEKSGLGHGLPSSLQERVSLSPPKARNSPAVTSAYEVKEENLQSNYEKDMMQYVAQIDRVSNPGYIGNDNRPDSVPGGSPGEPRNNHPYPGSYNSSHRLPPPQSQIAPPQSQVPTPSQLPPPPPQNQLPPQNHYTNEMLQFINSQQNLGSRNYSGASTSHEALARTPEQRVSPATSPYVSKPPPESSSSVQQHSGQMSQYMPPAAQPANMNFNDRTHSSLPPSASDKSSSPSLNSFSVKQEISQHPSHCSEESVKYGYSHSQANAVAFNSVSPKLEPKPSPYESSQEAGSANVYQDIKPPTMQPAPGMGMFQYGGFNPYTASHLPGDQIRSQYPGHMPPMSYYGQGPYPGSQMPSQAHMSDEAKSRMMATQQQYYPQSYPSNYEMALNTQRYFQQQGMMGNQWQSMQGNSGQMMGGYNKRKIMENGDNGVSATSKKSRGYNDEDYDFDLCNTWDEVTKVTPDVEESQNEGEEAKSSDNSENSDTVRTIFTYNFDPSLTEVSHKIILTEQRLCEDLKKIIFKKPILHIYNPLVYAFEAHLEFVKRYCNTTKTVLFLGMNPGPFGMSQNGVSIC